jgi:hypothetical protein
MENRSKCWSAMMAAEIYGETVLTVSNCTPNGRSHVLIVEMAYTGKGRGDIPN